MIFCNCIKFFEKKSKNNTDDNENNNYQKNKLLHLSNHKCLLCNKKIKKDNYNILTYCDNCHKQWRTCLDCPQLFEDLKCRIGKYEQNDKNEILFICYNCLI